MLEVAFSRVLRIVLIFPDHSADTIYNSVDICTLSLSGLWEHHRNFGNLERSPSSVMNSYAFSPVKNPFQLVNI